MTENKRATIAAVIPCFNDGTTLLEAVASVRAEQRVDELVVVDDGSDDPHTLDVFASLEAEGIPVVHRANGGLGAARMTGVLATSGDYVFCLDADDRLVAGALSQLARALEADDELALAWGDYRLFGDHSWRQETAPSLDPWQISYQNDIPASVLIRRSVLLGDGGWELRGGYEDWDMLMGLAERGRRGLRVATVVYEYRQHGVRMLGESAARHGDIYTLLRSRHPALFERRHSALARSDAPWSLKLALPLIFALPLSADLRRLIAGAACHLARRRGLRLLVRRVRTG
ncbi:MAG TPA: glycosyltransferase family A protein [Solirubrobacteraceae bacterium]|jgi:glycosyltransferase involved in cell wall biosynthesis|nr:glycosyltransferase family A protein [Solirubrobacteraceae bacterium]